MERFLMAKNVVIFQENGRWTVEYQGPSQAYKLSMPMNASGDVPDDILKKIAGAVLSGDFLAMPERVKIIR